MLNSPLREELRGVLGHELAHVRNRDILISTVVATIAGAIILLANMARWGQSLAVMVEGVMEKIIEEEVLQFYFNYLAPIAALLIQMAISRSREYAADKEDHS